jgi:tetratricopeptide (TPR) repeat protein
MAKILPHALQSFMSKEIKHTLQLEQKARQFIHQGDFLQAKHTYAELARLNENDPDIWSNLGFTHIQLGDISEAINCFKRASHLDSSRPEPYFNLAKAYRITGNFQAALANYNEALRLRPAWIEALYELGTLLLASGNAEAGIQQFQKVLSLDPQNTNAMINICVALQSLNRTEEAINGYWHVLQLKPTDPEAISRLKQLLGETQRTEELLKLCAHLKKYFPDALEPYAYEAKMLAVKGEWQEAQQILEPLLKENPFNYELVVSYFYIGRRANTTDKAIEMTENLLNKNGVSLNESQRSELYFNLGTLYDSQKEYDKAFPNFQAGNRLVGKKYNIEAHCAALEEMKTLLRRDFFEAAPRPEHTSKKPIFIVGMPRSGTSLVEQILDCHSLISAAGELNYISQLATATTNIHQPEIPYPQSITRLNTDDLSHLADQYIKMLEKHAPDAPFVTDKMPQNFIHVGLIKLLFPEAHVIHCQRNPVDTCLSCYFQDFEQGQEFAYDLEVLGRYYLSYQKLMQHWREVICNPFFDLQYEALVEHPRETIKSLLDYLNLPWEDACLDPQKNSRIVYTSSHDQVRQPLYTKSIGRWRNYEKHITPLMKLLEPDSKFR